MKKKIEKQQRDVVSQMRKQSLREKAVVAQFLVNEGERINHWELIKIDDADLRKIDILAKKNDLELPIQVTALVPELIDDFRNPEVFQADWQFNEDFARGYYDNLQEKGMKEEAFRYLFDHLNKDSFMALIEYPVKRKAKKYQNLDITDLILLLDSSPIDECPAFLCGDTDPNVFKAFWKYKFKEIYIVFEKTNLRIK
ncbi:MAG: hypothetical protein ACRCZE_05565 [Candidatus Altimarinota bacterium]